MIKKHKIRTISVALFLLATTSTVEAFWIDTHERISLNAIEQRSEHLTSTIKRQTGLPSGLSEIIGPPISSKIAKNWIIFGSSKEDTTPRYLNHFYSPINNVGLHDVFSGMSSYLWAIDTGNEWSWQTARARFYYGLVADTETERSRSLADVFRALGQLMHLVQDKAVPAHVRNDAHPQSDGFEAYVNRNVNSLNFLSEDFCGPSISVAPHAPRQLWNSDQYDGTNPSASTDIGLAEYTNANFASEDTIFTENNLADRNPLNDKHFFPFPRQEDNIIFAESQEKVWNGFEVYRKYFEKVSGGQKVKHFATASRLYKHLEDDPEPSIQGFDDRCYKDYADLLIPRAVGYSAALIDYFFRGKIDLTPDQSNPGYYRITNESDEDMSGTFKLYYDDKNGNRKKVATPAEWELNIAAKGVSPPVTFDAPSDATDAGTYMLVFQGTHGGEEGAVAGRNIALGTQTLPYIFLHAGSDTSGVVWDFVRDQEVILKSPENKELIAPYSKYAAETSLGVKFERPTPSFDTIDSGCGGLDCMFQRNGGGLEPGSYCYNLMSDRETGELIENGDRISSCGAAYSIKTDTKRAGDFSEGGYYSTGQTVNFESNGGTSFKGTLPNPNSGIAPSEFITKQNYEELVSTTRSWTAYEKQVEKESTSSNRALLLASAPNAGNLVMDIKGTHSHNSRYQKNGWNLVIETCEDSGNYVGDVREPYARAGGKIWTDKGRAWYLETAQIHYNYWMTFFRNDFYSCLNHFADWSEVLFDDIKQIFWVQFDRKQIYGQDGEAGWDYQWSAFTPISLEKIKDILARNSNYHRNKHEIFFYAVLAE